MCRPARLSLYLPFQNAQKPAPEDPPTRRDELRLDLGLEPLGLFLCRGSLTLALPLELFLLGLGGVKDFSVHQFGHELSGMFDAAHGATLSVMWPQWARYVVDTDPARFAHYGEAVWRLTR